MSVSKNRLMNCFCFEVSILSHWIGNDVECWITHEWNTEISFLKFCINGPLKNNLMRHFFAWRISLGTFISDSYSNVEELKSLDITSGGWGCGNLKATQKNNPQDPAIHLSANWYKNISALKKGTFFHPWIVYLGCFNLRGFLAFGVSLSKKADWPNSGPPPRQNVVTQVFQIAVWLKHQFCKKDRCVKQQKTES